MNWTKDKPTQPGNYQIRCMETDNEIQHVGVFMGRQGKRLMVHDDSIGVTTLDSYHDGLAYLLWLGPLPPPPSTEPAPQDTGETLRLKAHSWSDTSLYSETTGQQVCTHSIYGEATEDTQDELESLQARNMERLRDCWNLLAGHDLSQVAVVKKEAFNELLSAVSDIVKPLGDETETSGNPCCSTSPAQGRRIAAALTSLNV